MKKLCYAVELKNIYAYIFIAFIAILLVGTIKTTIDTGDMECLYAGMFGTIVSAIFIFIFIIFFPEAKKSIKREKD